MPVPSEFSAPAWSLQTNIYEVNLRQYTPEGSFAAFATHLPRLADMGVETLWFMPITPIATEVRQGTLGSYYACSSYLGTNPEYGSIEDFAALVKQVHALGMKVLIDWVGNHTGYGHEWTLSNKDYYVLDEEGNFTERNGWHDVIDLDFDNQSLRKAMIDAMAFWVQRCDIDGFRCDMAHLVPLDFWRQARLHLDKMKPLYWLAECEEPHYHPVFDCTYTWKWMHATRDMISAGKSVIVMDKILYAYHDEFPAHAQRLFFTTNHDENSWNGTEYEKYGEAALPLAVFTATWNGIPLVYSGQEIPNKKRLAFFEKDTIEWQEECALLPFYKILFELRRNNSALRAGDKATFTYRISFGEEQLFGFLRLHGNSQVFVILNFTGHNKRIFVTDHRVHGVFSNVFTGEKHSFDKERHLKIDAFGWIVMQSNNGV